jgi:uncharacterized protein YunC (DUF1805 family)
VLKVRLRFLPTSGVMHEVELLVEFGAVDVQQRSEQSKTAARITGTKKAFTMLKNTAPVRITMDSKE